MKSFRDLKLELNEASKAGQIAGGASDISKKITRNVQNAITTMKLRAELPSTANPAAITRAHLKLMQGQPLNKTQSSNYYAFASNVPANALGIDPSKARQIFSRLYQTKVFASKLTQQVAKQADIQAAAAAQKEIKEDLNYLPYIVRGVRSGKGISPHRVVGLFTNRDTANLVRAIITSPKKSNQTKLSSSQIDRKKIDLLKNRIKGTSTATSVSSGFKNSNVGKERSKIGPDGKSYVVREESIKEQTKEEFNPPALISLKRIGIRNFPDGRRVAMYLNKQLDLTFSVPYVGKGQTSGEIIPGVSSVQGGIKEEVEPIDEAQNVRVVGKKKIIRARIRAGKVQRRKVVSAVPGYKVVGGQVKRESSKERLDRKRGARKAKIKRRAKMARALIKRKRSLRKRQSMGL